jgi:hypothetical protein
MTSKKTLVTWINFSSKSWDRDNLIEKKIKKNNEVHFLKRTIVNDVIGKENNVKNRINFSNSWLDPTGWPVSQVTLGLDRLEFQK